MIFIRRVNERYQVCSQTRNNLEVLAKFSTWRQADEYAFGFKSYRPLTNTAS